MSEALTLYVTPESSVLVYPTLSMVHSIGRVISRLFTSVQWSDGVARFSGLAWFDVKGLTYSDYSTIRLFSSSLIVLSDIHRSKSGFFYSGMFGSLVMDSALAVCLRSLCLKLVGCALLVRPGYIIIQPFLYDYLTISQLAMFFDECEDIRIFRARRGVNRA